MCAIQKFLFHIIFLSQYTKIQRTTMVNCVAVGFYSLMWHHTLDTKQSFAYLRFARASGRVFGALRLPLSPGGDQVASVAALRALLLYVGRWVSAHNVSTNLRSGLQDTGLSRSVVVRHKLGGVVLVHRLLNKHHWLIQQVVSL
jgi:hypothetical protein